MTDQRLIDLIVNATYDVDIDDYGHWRKELAQHIAEQLGSKVVWADDLQQVGWYDLTGHLYELEVDSDDPEANIQSEGERPVFVLRDAGTFYASSEAFIASLGESTDE